MISEGIMRKSESGSAESLLDFLNTASTSVKHVLEKPGCFKRNTNHRRFLQKQLKVNKQKNTSSSSSRKTISKHQFPLDKVRQRSASRKRILLNAEINSSKIPKVIERSNVEYISNGQAILSMRLNDQNRFQRENLYFAECKKSSEMVDDLVDKLLDSSSQDENRQRVVSLEAPFYPYNRSGSVSSNSSSSSEEINPDFLSGEELLRCLDISELFIPEGLAVQPYHREEENSSPTDELQIVPGDESPVPEQLMYETDMIDTQSMPVFENVFQQFSL